MTTAAAATTYPRDDSRARAQVVTWALTQTANVGEAVRILHGRDKTVQFGGTFGGSTCILQGSNDGNTWYTLTDPQGNAISSLVTALEQVSEATLYVRPSSSGGDGTQDVSVTLFAARPWSA